MAMATKRLAAEFKELCRTTTDGLVAGPLSDDDLFRWEALIMGPEGTPYEFGVFRAILTFPTTYPMKPPKMVFTTPITHPNVYGEGARRGEVCISILHAPGEDRFGYEKSYERWTPVQSIEKVLLSVISMLAEPNAESPANIDAAKLWRDDRASFDAVVRAEARRSLGLA
uniref:UBC core domain-containing protein n=1 Tax=Bicosoecida sp. CB-2014 TaxID=1486930 RepID=A0A7S1CHY3_9STRA|mmetsp:Transcript_25431/g.88747  ORF Transcript_25431/g.88747 Transcript_25431/m.88747 type:complete len:170 (+) Transcript_25431:244-753(+)